MSGWCIISAICSIYGIQFARLVRCARNQYRTRDVKFKRGKLKVTVTFLNVCNDSYSNNQAEYDRKPTWKQVRIRSVIYIPDDEFIRVLNFFWFFFFYAAGYNILCQYSTENRIGWIAATRGKRFFHKRPRNGCCVKCEFGKISTLLRDPRI